MKCLKKKSAGVLYFSRNCFISSAWLVFKCFFCYCKPERLSCKDSSEPDTPIILLRPAWHFNRALQSEHSLWWVSQLMEPSVSLAATIQESHLWTCSPDGAQIHQLYTKEEALFFTCHITRILLFFFCLYHRPQLWFLSLYLVPCDKVGGKKIEVAKATAASLTVAD